MKLRILEGKALTKLIGSIGLARVQLDGQIQAACLQVIAQSVLHRNVTPGNALVEAVSKHHTATLVTYLERFGNFAWDKKETKLVFRETHATDQLEAALEMIGDHKWYDAKKPPKVVSEYDAVKVIGDVFDKLFKAKSKGIAITNGPVLEAAHAAYCAAIAKAYDEGDKSVEKLAIDQALEARGKGLATPAQLKMLAEHYGKPVQQIVDPSAKEEFGGTPTAVQAVNQN
jgi:hypothetical protein